MSRPGGSAAGSVDPGLADEADLGDRRPGHPQHQRATGWRVSLGAFRGGGTSAGLRQRITSSPVAGQYRNACGSNSASELAPGTEYEASRAGDARFATSNSDTWVPVDPALGRAVLADADQPGPVGRVQVGRVAGDLQLAPHRRLGRIAKVHCVQRVGLPERDHVAGRADEPDRVDLLTLAQPFDRAPHGQLLAVLDQHVDPGLASCPGAVGMSDVDAARRCPVPFGQRVLVDQVARDCCRRPRRPAAPPTCRTCTAGSGPGPALAGLTATPGARGFHRWSLAT